ncbi:MAG: Gfo/Idh/MocA family oxidoreductase [Candidatus Omnitrophica bacterium]|nr:Gfo/Idh/MocA family oxidoreductase [Candidatus Omnitrophota bacterium]
MKKFRVAVIGTGFIGNIHCEQLMRISNVMLAGIADKNPALASEAAARFGAEKIYKNADEVLSDGTIDVIHNCTPNNLHYEINKRALESGKQVFSEKPLALTAKESSELVKLAEKENAVTGINFCYRYYPVVQEAAVRVAGGEIGAVYNIHGNYLQDWLLYPTDYSWRLDPSMAGASNIVGDLGSHWCDLAQFVSGLKIIEVMAELKTILPVRKRPKTKETLTFSNASDIDYEDVKISLDEYGALLLRFDNGACGTFTTSQLAAGRKCNIDLQVYGSKGSVAWNHERSAELWFGHRNEPNRIFFESPNIQSPETRRFARLPSGHPMGYMDAIMNLFNDFYRAIELKRANKTPDFRHPDFKAGHEEMLILEAAIRSRKSGTWAKVDTV